MLDKELAKYISDIKIKKDNIYFVLECSYLEVLLNIFKELET